MTVSRRIFLHASAVGAAAGLPRSLRADWVADTFGSLDRAGRQAASPLARPLLDLALRAAAWIDQSHRAWNSGLSLSRIREQVFFGPLISGWRRGRSSGCWDPRGPARPHA